MPRENSPTSSAQRASRRRFLQASGAGLAAFTIASPDLLGGPRTAPNDQLGVAFVGVGGRGGANLGGLSRGGNNVVALCDVDDARAGGAYKRFPKAQKFKDFRKMFDAVHQSIDAVAVSTPDHTHAAACMAALELEKHTYCEKPLAHSVHEVRALMKAAKEAGVVTQLGNQGHSSDAIRRTVEFVRDGAIGDVHTIHASCSAVHCRIGDLKRRGEKPAIPKELDWDLWLGPAKDRPFHPMYIRGAWRAWRPYGNGTIGDWVCHVVDPSFWALDLGLPSTIELVRTTEFDAVAHNDTFPAGEVIRFEFPAKGKRKKVTMYWYSGSERIPQPKEFDTGRKPPQTGAVLVGTKGVIQHGSHGAGGVIILPDALRKEYKEPERTIRRVPGHHGDFLQSIREGHKAGSDFAEYGGPLTEIAMLGVIAQNFPGQKLEWDGAAGRFKNNDAATALINPPTRKGFSI